MTISLLFVLFDLANTFHCIWHKGWRGCMSRFNLHVYEGYELDILYTWITPLLQWWTPELYFFQTYLEIVYIIIFFKYFSEKLIRYDNKTIMWKHVRLQWIHSRWRCELSLNIWYFLGWKKSRLIKLILKTWYW